MAKKKIVRLKTQGKHKARAINMTFQDLSANRVSFSALESRSGWSRFWDRILADTLLSEMEEAA